MKCRFKKNPLSASDKIANSNRDPKRDKVRWGTHSAEPIEKERLKATHYALYAKPAFSLVETVTALIILALISSSVLVVISRCMASAADSALRMQAFEVSRKNMETLLSKDSVAETVEYGSSDKYPEIQWQTTVETFYEPLTSQMWIQAVCSAEYTDSAGELQTVELTHWLTNLTKEQLLEIIKQRQKELSAEQVIETEEEAAEYADVDVETIQQWVDNGMPMTEDGHYIKSELDLYRESDGRPTIEDRRRLAKEREDEKSKGDKEEPPKEEPPKEEPPKEEPPKEEPPKDELPKDEPPEEEPIYCGYTMEELMRLPSNQLFEILWNCDEL